MLPLQGGVAELGFDFEMTLGSKLHFLLLFVCLLCILSLFCPEMHWSIPAQLRKEVENEVGIREFGGLQEKFPGLTLLGSLEEGWDSFCVLHWPHQIGATCLFCCQIWNDAVCKVHKCLFIQRIGTFDNHFNIYHKCHIITLQCIILLIFADFCFTAINIFQLSTGFLIS